MTDIWLTAIRRWLSFATSGFIMALVFAPAEVTWLSKSMAIVGALLLTWDSFTRKPAAVGTIPTSAMPIRRAKVVQLSTAKVNGYTLRLTRPAKVVDTEIN